MRKYFGNYFFLILGIIFPMVSIGGGGVSGGVGCRCRGSRSLKKQLEGSWGGGRSASPLEGFPENAT